MALASADAKHDRETPGLLRRLHSLSGVVPLGAFVVLHVWMTASIGGSRELYDRQVGFLHGGALLGVLEIVLVLLPLVYHGAYGLVRSLQPREADHAYDDDVMLALQRASGIVVLLFVVLHVWEFRGQTWANGLAVSSYSTKLVEDLSSTTWGIPWIALGYLVGTAATLFHLVNGLTSFCTTWGFASTAPAQRRARLLFRALGVFMFVVSAALVVQVATGARLFSAYEPSSSAAPCGSAAASPPPPPPPAARASSSPVPAPSSAPTALPDGAR